MHLHYTFNIFFVQSLFCLHYTSKILSQCFKIGDKNHEIFVEIKNYQHFVFSVMNLKSTKNNYNYVTFNLYSVSKKYIVLSYRLMYSYDF